ncbi:hypothetical protein ACLKA6_006770 [Drosophila palustris]
MADSHRHSWPAMKLTPSTAPGAPSDTCELNWERDRDSKADTGDNSGQTLLGKQFAYQLCVWGWGWGWENLVSRDRLGTAFHVCPRLPSCQLTAHCRFSWPYFGLTLLWASCRPEGGTGPGSGSDLVYTPSQLQKPKMSTARLQSCIDGEHVVTHKFSASTSSELDNCSADIQSEMSLRGSLIVGLGFGCIEYS